jgi:hypothetical protein
MEPRKEAARDLEAEVDADRRKFLASCGKFAAVTPPALTILLSTSLSSDAIARSGGGGRGRDRDLPSWLERLLDRLF